MWDSLRDQTPRLKLKLESFEMFQINFHTPSTWFRNFGGGHRPKNVELKDGQWLFNMVGRHAY